MGLIHSHSNILPQSELSAQRSSRLNKKERKKKDHTHVPPQTQLATGDIEAGAKLGESRGREAFGEDVRELGGGRNMKDPHLAYGHPITDKV
jgi:hypothetical protein